MTSQSPQIRPVGRRSLLAGAAAGLGGWLLGAKGSHGDAQAQFRGAPVDYPVVVELFTSQGCSSCPPADAFLAELSKRQDVIALAYHVDYWDRLGWKDPFSSSWATQLQSSYSRRHNRRNNYTPQMIVDGEVDVIGSRRNMVLRAVEDELAKAQHQPRVKVAFIPNGEKVTVDLSGMANNVEAEVLLMRYDELHQTKIGRGENGGRTLNYHHVVRERRVLGRWRGEPVQFKVPKPGYDNAGLAVLVQERNYGPIIGAGQLRPDAII
ncbi:MAG: DUF1223 domain-containing protein [Alphaproteobacteria bacterium]|nr:DUF1223 domain-containing protein [Alphaproteobacteria bacterium SS10]